MAKRRQAKRSGRSGPPAWVWLVAGVVLGLAISVFVLIRQGFDPRGLAPQPDPSAKAPARTEEPVAQRAEAAPKKPKYDFYTLLPEKEVAIPDAELSRQAAAEPPPAAEAGARYLLQAGAFPDAARAEAMKAQLALQGLVAKVHSDRIDGVLWHRVRLGPYSDLRELEAAKRQLADRGIDALAIKVPQG